MTIEESVQKDPSKFQAALDNATPDIEAALKEISVKFDKIFGGVIMQYAESEHVEAEISDILTYKTVNRLITGRIDELVKGYIKDKRKDIL